MALIPELASTSDPGSFESITVLPVFLKTTMRCWLALVSPFLQVRRLQSHGLRPGFQAAEAQWDIRALLQKHKEFSMRVVVCKLDIYKAYVTLRWEAIDSTSRKLGLSRPLRHADWRMHRGRTLRFHTPDGSVIFSVVPTQDSPWAVPENPLAYAVVMEKLSEFGENNVIEGGRPAGLTLQPGAGRELESRRSPWGRIRCVLQASLTTSTWCRCAPRWPF